MTLNLMWSDQNSSYLIVDSARTHQKPPRFSHSILGQRQVLRENVTVEEGAQKIIPLSDNCVLALCGNEIDITRFAECLKSGMRCGSIYDVCDYLTKIEKSAKIEVSIAVTESEPPFTVFKYPARQLYEVVRTHTHITGSLAEAHKEMLIGEIRRHHLSNNKLTENCELKLVLGLAFATTMAANFALTENYIGGAFFGATLNRSGFSWQPDIVYILYHSEFSNGLPVVLDGDTGSDFSNIADADTRVDLVACIVRDNVSVSISPIGNALRCTAACSDMSCEDFDWKNRWEKELTGEIFCKPKYYVFVPKQSPGQIVVAENNQQHIRIGGGSIRISSDLVDKLKSKPRGRAFQACLIK
ncbi:hypothetical protein [uncultured Thiodictyon sp.]|uniref:hypothetical protein n=1 Tax=uncultured Thiodictyon sp. TaxID=1846217 RepID=UPI0025F96C67|nr:hypothetical protein [uncultured Thiodictyon sp.]